MGRYIYWIGFTVIAVLFYIMLYCFVHFVLHEIEDNLKVRNFRCSLTFSDRVPLAILHDHPVGICVTQRFVRIAATLAGLSFFGLWVQAMVPLQRNAMRRVDPDFDDGTAPPDDSDTMPVSTQVRDDTQCCKKEKSAFLFVVMSVHCASFCWAQSVIHQVAAILFFCLAFGHGVIVVYLYCMTRRIAHIAVPSARWLKIICLASVVIPTIVSFWLHPGTSKDAGSAAHREANWRSQVERMGLTQWGAVMCIILYFATYGIDFVAIHKDIVRRQPYQQLELNTRRTT